MAWWILPGFVPLRTMHHVPNQWNRWHNYMYWASNCRHLIFLIWPLVTLFCSQIPKEYSLERNLSKMKRWSRLRLIFIQICLQRKLYFFERSVYLIYRMIAWLQKKQKTLKPKIISNSNTAALQRAKNFTPPKYLIMSASDLGVCGTPFSLCLFKSFLAWLPKRCCFYYWISEWLVGW